ncbi:T9SS type A sorting domain-containing protein [Kaistella jeonii]|uniref:Uncharacterized protein n=1 Tax=Kaistella jeonii TaxID=266749 RepID=A0A0C1F8K6_9FLAO|nr:T9SS type A sorting domain-containing protein [Kaistella jeonii]KIA88218.1 hypothetical protein OA86_11900 [Kaistella jeonii]SFC26119.1 Por secretion system C-terminal sorting domain-containing protein [Kaistella jeonii]VEI95682.1 Por secretion system C-terminal sorting domain [Kaistella jeonii]
MKKFLLSCFLALGITSSAQYSYTGDFENPGYNVTTYKQFGGGSQFAGAACNGAFGGRILPTASITQSGYMIDLSTLGQTNNGQKVDFSVSYKKAAGVTGTIQLAYFVYDSVTALWSINYVGTVVTLATGALTTCSTLTATLPSGTFQPGDIVGVGAWFTRSGTANAGIYLDDIIVNQDNTVIAAPACTTITSPADGSTISAGTASMKWSAVPTAVNYKVTVGTTPGGSELYTGTVAGTSLNFTLAKSTMYYAKVVPSNLNGDATGCTGITFTSDANIAYCGGITATSTVYPLSSVSLNGATKTSSAATGAPAYEDFTTTVFNVKSGSTYPLTAIATGLGANVFGMTVFVDWNEDGDFNDANEKYFQDLPLVTGTGTPINLSGSLAVPVGTTVGMKRMRVKYNFNGSTTTLQPALSDACANMTNGQTEDYTLSVTLLTDAPLCATISAPVDGSTTFPANGLITWGAVAEASGYKLYIGTTLGGTDVANGVVVTTTSYQAALTSGVTYYAKVVPYNVIGDATGCTGISFTAAAVLYCLPAPGFAPGSVEPTTNVTIANINNTTSAVVGGTPGYEDFTSIVGTVLTGTDYPISLNANTDGASFYHFFAVFIDWNQDGDFDDAGEKYFTTVPTFVKIQGSNGVTGTPATGTISVPSTAKLGNTRMRVKSAFYASTGPSTDPNLTNFANGCSTVGSSYGQVEDYTLFVKDVTTATVNVDKNKVSVYPNPFKDVLNISDVKGVKSITISDVSGRQVKTMKPSTELQVSDLKTGLYIVNLHMEDGTIKSIKAIKK